MFRSIGPVEIGIVLVIILIIFGVGKLPSVGGALGRGIHEFRKATRGGYDDDKDETLKTDSKPETKAEDKSVKS